MTITFLICSHRAPASMEWTLESLARQTRRDGAEVVIINNGFSDEREQSLRKFAEGKGLSYPLRFIRETTPGLGFSRRRGFMSDPGDWIVMLDDDNTIEATFVEKLHRYIADDPELRGLTPLVTPVWEKEPSRMVAELGVYFLSYNHIRFEKDRIAGRFGPAQFAKAARPPGGGMIIHRSVTDSYMQSVTDPRRAALERTGDNLVSCQDQDIWEEVGKVGGAVLVTPELKVDHHIPAGRLKFWYIMRLNYAFGWSYTVLDRMLGRQTFTAPIRSYGQLALYLLRMFKIWILRPNPDSFWKQAVTVAKALGAFNGQRVAISGDAIQQKRI